MKIEMDDNSLWASVAIAAMLTILGASLGGCYICKDADKAAMKAGLVQESVPSHYQRWAKPN